jgi:NodT family efflux transporter outer membrane factor (OMF) lipoprotein
MNVWKMSVSGCVLAVLAGCAVGPDFHQPAPPTTPRITAQPLPAQTVSAATSAGAAQAFVVHGDVPADWWTLFNSPVLNRLVQDALAASPTLEAARAALKIADENAAVERAAFFPGLSAGFDATRQQTSQTLSPVLNSPVQTFNLFTPQLSLSYSPDLWGGVRRSVESADAQARAQKFALDAAHLTLASNVAVAAIQYASLLDQIAAQQKITADAEQLRAMMQDQFAHGAISQTALESQATLAKQAEAALSALKKQRAQQVDLLAALSGRTPADFTAPELHLSDLVLPGQVPVSLPADLVRQRPDVRMAEENLHSASAQVGVAIAAMLPNITLSGSAGSAAIAIGQLFAPGTGFWTIGAGIVQPLFDGGALLAKKRAADAGLDQARAQYKSAVVTAFQNTADALEAVHYDADALAADAAAAAAAQGALRRTRHQRELGDIGLPAVLLAEQSNGQAQIALIQGQATRYADTVGLYQALGGGWWHDAPPAQSQ